MLKLAVRMKNLFGTCASKNLNEISSKNFFESNLTIQLIMASFYESAKHEKSNVLMWSAAITNLNCWLNHVWFTRYP